MQIIKMLEERFLLLPTEKGSNFVEYFMQISVSIISALLVRLRINVFITGWTQSIIRKSFNIKEKSQEYNLQSWIEFKQQKM